MHSVPTALRAFLLSPVIALNGLGFTIQPTHAATEDGALRMEVITAYNLVVDSNIESPAFFSPLAARLVECYGIVDIKLNDGTEQFIPSFPPINS